MPAKRLPWIKLHVSRLEEARTGMLPDPLFATWVRLYAHSSQQPTRWCFTSAEHAAYVTRRPLKHVRELIARGLLEVGLEHMVRVVDAEREQEQYPSDVGHDPTPNAPRTSAERSAKTPPTLREDSAEIKREIEIETGEEDEPLAPGGAAPPREPTPMRQAVPKPVPQAAPVGQFVDAVRALDPGVVVTGNRGYLGNVLKANPEADIGLMAEAYVSFLHGDWPGSAKLRETGDPSWLVGDVGGYALWKRNGGQVQRPKPKRAVIGTVI